MHAPTMATVPVRIAIDKCQKVSAFLASVQNQATEMIPFEQTGLHRIARVSEQCQRACGFQTLLIVHPKGTTDIQPAFGSWVDSTRTENFNAYAIMLEIFLGQSDATVKVSFDSRVVAAWIVENLVERFESIVGQLINAGADATINDMTIMTQKDLDLIWQRNGNLPRKVERYVHDIVTGTAKSCPSVQAIHAWDGDLTYAELDVLSDSLAAYFFQKGVQPGQVVPVCFEKSMWTPVVMLSLLKVQAAFVLLDTSLPEERLKAITSQVGSDCIVSSNHNKTLSSRLARRVIDVEPSTIDRSLALDLPEQSQDYDATMFVIFTSGSTGTPKGVMLSHANFASQIEHQAEILGYNSTSRVFDFAAYSFDAAVHNVFTTFAVGGCLCIPSGEDRKGDITRVMADMAVTLADLTPTVARLLNPAALPALDNLTLSGEAVTVDDVERWWGHSQVINAYGPAEAGISTINHNAKSPEEVTNIGFGAGLITWIVHPDDPNVLLPPGVVGELLLEGPLVGNGYLNDSDKTAASFIDSPVWMVKTRSSRLYKTGDLVQYAEDGSIVYLGRKDTQVKIRGQRIELGEIEHCLGLSLPKVRQVVVEAVKPGGSYKNTFLAAFITEDSQHSVSSITPKSLEADVMDQLAIQLPAAMIPSVFFFLPELPRTATGKTDRKQLRELGSKFSIDQLVMAKSSGLPKVQPTTPMQIKMQAIWAAVLALDVSLIGLDDSFIQLGGDSIAAMKVVGETRQLGLCLSVADIFRTPKLRDLSDGVSATSEAEIDTINPVAHSNPVELSFAQGRLWFVEKLYPGLTWFLMPFAMRFRGSLQVDALEQALHAIENRHDALRSTFLTENGVHFQQVHPFIGRKMPVIDVSAGGGEALTKALRTEQGTTFDLSREAGWRVMLFRLGPNHHVLSIVLHHINADGWSINVIRKELTQFYSAAVKGQDPTSKFGPLPIQYRDYSAWQKQKFDNGDFEHQLAYWTSKLEASRPAEFLCDKPRPKTISGKANAHEWRIEGHVYNQVREFCKDNGVTPFVVMLAAFRTMHYCMTGADDATIGTANANRDHWQLKDMIGFFVNMQCLRIKVQDDTFRSIVSQVQQTLAESFNNQDVPFERIVSALKRERDLSRQPIVQVVFALHALGTSGTIGLEGVESEMLDLEPTSRFDLELHIFEEKAAFNGVLVFSTDLSAPETIASMVSVFNTILEGAMRNPDEKIADLPLLNCEGHDLLKSMGLVEMVRTDYPQNSNVVSVFQQQAATNGDKVAVKGSCHQITYAELDSMSDSVAYWLMAQEFGSQAVIPVMAKRSPETIVAFMGILKANMAYLPLDAKTPSGRLHSILSSIKNPTVVLLGADVDLPTEIDTPSTSIQTVLKTNTRPSSYLRLIVAQSPSGSSLAYILFTSGSTGQPKGVMIEHRNILRLVLQNNYTQYLTKTGAVSHMLSIAFDASVLEIYTALLNGLTLVCIDHEVLLDPAALQKTFFGGKVGAAIFTPVHLKQVLAERPDAIGQLDTLVVGGDRLDPDDCILAAKMVKRHVINAYGPTENTVISTLYPVSEADTWANGVPIGRAMSNSGAHIMDSQLRLLPLGAIGELVVTGDGLARGYSESERDVGRFVSIEIDGVKMRGYRTGDLARFRPMDGHIEFFGRKDVQVKIRGHRVELGEIEHVLLGHDSVTDAAALIHQDDGPQAQLHAFVVAQHQEQKVKDGIEDSDAEAGCIQTWKRLFDNDHYAGIEDMKEIGRDFTAWTSMYDGALIDKGEMNEWLDDTITTINQNIGAGHVLEIGTGTGMILFNLIDVLKTYIGLDPAERAVDYVNNTINSNSSIADRTRVYRGTADRLDNIPTPITPNLIICNSVAQYFPSQEYLFNVIKDIVRRPCVETLFFGDMRSQALYTEFCVTKGLCISGQAITKRNLRRRIAEIKAEEMELLIDPGFFTGLKSRLADYVEHVEILAKNMVATNELSCYRYAAVVHIKQRSRRRQIYDIDQRDRVDFAGEGLDHAALVHHLQRSSSQMISVENIPHSKTIYERFVVSELAKSDDEEHKDWLSSVELAAQQASALSVCELNEIAQQAGYRVQISWARQHILQGGFDAVFHQIVPEREGTRVLFNFPSDEQGRPLQTLSSNPLSHQAHRKVHDELQTRLHHHLPSYMCPQTIIILDEMPVNTSGKVDRKALAEILHARTAPTQVEIRKPNTMAEELLQHIWASVLNLDPSSIGLEENFFQLGGNSITAMRVITETRKQGMDLEISDIFRSKNLEDLAGLSLKHVDKVEMDEEQGPLISEDTTSSILAELGGDNQFQAILPPTSMQELYITEGKSAGGQFANYFFLDLPTSTNPGKLRASCQQLLCNIPLLRASFLSIAGRYWQVVPHALDVPWLELNTKDSVQQFSHDFCREDMKKISHVGPPVLFTLVKHEIEGARLIFRLSHAQYDGVSFPSIVQALFSAYFGTSHSLGPDYSTFLLHAMRQRPASIAYWKNLLQDSSLESIRSYLPLCDRGVEPRPVAVQAEVALPSLIGNITTATIASAAWALLMARITGSQDVVYGHAVAGRNSRIPRIDELVGPCLTIVPVRATLSSSQTCEDFLRRLQIQFSSMGDADSLSYRDIINDCTKWPAEAQFDTIIHHANLDEHPEFDFGGEKTKLEFFRNKQLVPNHTTLMSYPLGDRLQFNVISSTHIMSEETASALVSGLCEIVTRMDARPKEAFSTWMSEVYREI
ncbi:Enniatin synthase [Fusarium albosuccineum]|uniref:Enniatin synthase n=1 Tax=Fusarium albosuccineum TaxID=1237068 RepID=A0A8H4L2D5_9HYPO|nr:Enniatin synthase [Fusarium albosuccineum]